MGSTPWCPTPTTPITAIARTSASRPRACARSTITTASAPAWRASSGCTRTASSPSCMAAAMTSLPSRTLPRWPTGIPPRRTAVGSTAGSAVSRMSCSQAARRISSSTSTKPSRSRCAAASMCPWYSTIPRSSCARVSTRRSRCWRRWRKPATLPIRPSATSWTWRAARRMPRRSCARHGRATKARSTMASSRSI